jgi:hypothetical protein
MAIFLMLFVYSDKSEVFLVVKLFKISMWPKESQITVQTEMLMFS